MGFGLAVIIGSTLGIGILRAPGLVAGQIHAPGAIILVWIAGGVYTLLASVCLTELGGLAPQAGGYHVYARRAFGDWIGFAVGWTDWITYCAVLGYVSIGMSEFLAQLVPALSGAVTPVAIALLVGFVGLQWAGVRVSSRFQDCHVWRPPGTYERDTGGEVPTTAYACSAAGITLAKIAEPSHQRGAGVSAARCADRSRFSLPCAERAVLMIGTLPASWTFQTISCLSDRPATCRLPISIEVATITPVAFLQK